MFKIVSCRGCGARKAVSDPCPVCGKGLAQETLKCRKNQPISLTTAHGLHSAAMVPSQVARALVRF